MVTLDTLRALHEHEHKLAAYCATCERWAVLDLERLIAGRHVAVKKYGRVGGLVPHDERDALRQTLGLDTHGSARPVLGRCPQMRHGHTL